LGSPKPSEFEIWEEHEMKMFKRFAAALLAGVMVLAMLTACGGGAGGPGESEFEKKVQDVYMAALNKEYGTEWSNNSEVKELATEALNKIADGKIALADVTPKKATEENWVGAVVCVENAMQNAQVYTAVYYEETTAGTITVDSDVVKLMKTATDLVIEAGKEKNVEVEVTGLGVGTKTVGGKTYVAIGFKLSK
jgi:hypothetical protein